MYIADLDITAETDFSEIKQFAEQHGCTVELLTEFGPGAGHPVYRFASDNIHFITELTEQLDYPAEEVIEEV